MGILTCACPLCFCPVRLCILDNLLIVILTARTRVVTQALTVNSRVHSSTLICDSFLSDCFLGVISFSLSLFLSPFLYMSIHITFERESPSPCQWWEACSWRPEAALCAFFFCHLCSRNSLLPWHTQRNGNVLPFSAKSHFFCACWAALKITAKTNHAWMSRR